MADGGCHAESTGFGDLHPFSISERHTVSNPLYDEAEADGDNGKEGRGETNPLYEEATGGVVSQSSETAATFEKSPEPIYDRVDGTEEPANASA